MAQAGWSRKAEVFSTESVAEKNAREARERAEKEKASGITEEEKRKRREAAERMAAERKAREEKERVEKERKAKADKEAADKAAADAAAAAAKEAESISPVPECVQGLLMGGGFTRRLSFRERRALRRVEKAAEALRSRIEQAIGAERCEGAFAVYAFDSLANIEVACRLELLRKPPAE